MEEKTYKLLGGSGALNIAGLVLGIMAKLEEDKFYLFAWIGIVLNALTLLGIGGIVAVGVYGL